MCSLTLCAWQNIVELEGEESYLDELIERATNMVKVYTKTGAPSDYPHASKDGLVEPPGMLRKYMTVSRSTLKSLPAFDGHAVVAIRAPQGTVLDVADPTQGLAEGERRYQMYLKSPDKRAGPVDVFLINAGASGCLGDSTLPGGQEGFGREYGDEDVRAATMAASSALNSAEEPYNLSSPGRKRGNSFDMGPVGGRVLSVPSTPVRGESGLSDADASLMEDALVLQGFGSPVRSRANSASYGRAGGEGVRPPRGGLTMTPAQQKMLSIGGAQNMGSPGKGISGPLASPGLTTVVGRGGNSLQPSPVMATTFLKGKGGRGGYGGRPAQGPGGALSPLPAAGGMTMTPGGMTMTPGALSPSKFVNLTPGMKIDESFFEDGEGISDFFSSNDQTLFA